MYEVTHSFCRPGYLLLLVLCASVPACRHQEPYKGGDALDPQIIVQETPAKPLPSDLVVYQTPPTPPPAPLAQLEAAPLQPDRPTSQLPVSTGIIPVVQHEPVIPPIQAIHQPRTEPKRMGLLASLESYLEFRTEDAVNALKHYPPDDQDIALVTMPLLARIEQGESYSTLNGNQKLAILESLRNLCRRLSKSAPLVLQHVTLAKEQSYRFGEVVPRQDSNYYVEDLVCIYAEILNLLDYPNSEGIYNIRLDVTLELLGPDGKVAWNDSKPFQKMGSITSRNDYHISARFQLLRHLPPGNYTVQITVLDRDTNRTARQTLPLQILESKNNRKP